MSDNDPGARHLAMAAPESTRSSTPVSVVIPAFNAAGTVGRTLDSLRAQSHTAWTAVVVDDGSTDGTAAIVAGYAAGDSRITLVRQANGGESAARNAGIAHAGHEWLLFLDADDRIAPAHLERMTAALAADPTLDAVHCGYARVAADGTEVIEEYEPPTGDLFPLLARRAAFPVHACVVRTALVREVGLFDTTLKTSPDWDLWQRIARTGARFGAVREVLAYYHMSPGSASLDANQLFADGVRVLKQGMGPDPRVPRPHPSHANGLSGERLETQEFYLLCWCAGLTIGSGRDARPLLALVGDDRFPELWPPAVAQCLFDSIPLPGRVGPLQWERVWPAVRRHVSEFLAALEQQVGAPALATRAEEHLARLIADSSPTLSLLRHELRVLTSPLEDLRTAWTALSEHQRAEQAEMAALRDEVARLRDVVTAAEHSTAAWQSLASQREQVLADQRRAFDEALGASQRLAADRARMAEEHAATIEELRRSIERAQQALAAVQAERDAHARQAAEGATERLAQQRLLDERAATIVDLGTHVEQLQQTLAAVQAERDAHARQADERATTISDLGGRVEALEQTRASLQAERDQWQHLADAHAATAAEQQLALEAQRALSSALQDELTGVRNEQARWQGLAEEHATTVAAQAARHADLETALRHERAGRQLMEQHLQLRDRDIVALDQTLRERDAALTAQLDEHANLRAELEARDARADELEASLARERAALERAALQRRHLEETVDWSKRELARTRRSVHAVEQALRAEATALNGRAAELEVRETEQVRRHAQELHELRVSPEWRIGHLLWNGAKLSRVGQPVARFARRAQSRRTREQLATPRSTTGPAVAVEVAAPARRAVAAACWNFPIPSQTFVYQEVQGLEWAGFDYRFFCCQADSRDGLPDAFHGVWDRHVVLKTDWAIGQEDLAYFVAARPDRVEGLLTRLGEATGLSREALLQESIVLNGFTFARNIEAFGADYLHTYFFYDQSFMGLMAGWLLGIPRGITAYADHMLNDYPFKLVALQVELADIVVATSARIKTELSALSGGRFDDKILVKPNGVNTSRFPYVPAATRLAEAREPELLSVSRIEPKKGLIHLVEAVGLLTERGVHVRLNIVGGVDQHTPSSAECHRELVARIDALKLGDRVILHGPKQQSEFLPIMKRSHAFVAPYVEVSSGDKDGIPTAVLEAMSCGLPIVATDAGSITEAVTHDVEALVVPQRDPAALAEAIASLVTDRARYTRMSDAARHRAVSEFDARVTEQKLHDRIAALVP